MASRHGRQAPDGVPIASRAWAVLMERLGYKRYVPQGGDWGSVVSDLMACQAPAGLLGVHVNMPATVPPEIATANFLAASVTARTGSRD